ncbi:MAG: class I SAM-dependent methyltransferase [Verrucomicrobia bacterium]|nr:class I SAM-dependent methyltransferase [Verrucomicrobiota bacterium]
MHNILNQPPPDDLHGRLAFTVNSFVPKILVEGKSVLNVGCGYGWFELWATRSGVARMAAIDVTESDLETARRHVQDPRVEFKTGSAIEIPYPDRSFDTVVSWEVIEHIPRNTEPKMFAEVARVLKPGGRFLLSTPNRHWLSILLDPTVLMIDHRHYSIGFLQQIAVEQGFRLDQHVVKCGLPEALDMWNLYVSKWIFRRDRFFKEASLRMTDRDYARPAGFNTLFAHFERTD